MKTYNFAMYFPIVLKTFYFNIPNVTRDRKEVTEIQFDSLKNNFKEIISITPIEKEKRRPEHLIDVYYITGKVEAPTKKIAEYLVYSRSRCNDYFEDTKFRRRIKVTL